MLSRFQSLAVVLSIVVTSVSVRVLAESDSLQMPGHPLQPRLDSMKAQFVNRAPKEIVDLYQSAIDDLRESDIVTRALNSGDTVPDFVLPNAAGNPVRLSQVLTRGPVVVTWYRGGWCPYCNVTLRAWMEALPELKRAGGQLIAISPEIPDSSLSTRQRLALDFEVLSDSDNHVARQFGIVYKLPEPIIASYSKFFSLSAYNGTQGDELPLAATYIIDANRVIRYDFVDADYKVRAEPSDVIKTMREIQRR